jgi:hypothetical protein
VIRPAWCIRGKQVSWQAQVFKHSHLIGGRKWEATRRAVFAALKAKKTRTQTEN